MKGKCNNGGQVGKNWMLLGPQNKTSPETTELGRAIFEDSTCVETFKWRLGGQKCVAGREEDDEVGQHERFECTSFGVVTVT